MNDQHDIEALQDLLVQRVLGEDLGRHELERLERAMARDPALAALASSLQRTVEQLAAGIQAEPPARLRARLLESVRRESRGRAPARSRVSARWSFAMAASVALVMLVAGAVLLVDNGRLRRDLELQSLAAGMLHEPNVVLSFTLRGTAGEAGASGLVLLDLDARRASIAVRDLPALPAGQSYHLWALLDSKKVPCGQFQVRADGRILTQFPIPVDSYAAPIEKLVMTIESGTDIASPLGPVVMASS